MPGWLDEDSVALSKLSSHQCLVWCFLKLGPGISEFDVPELYLGLSLFLLG